MTGLVFSYMSGIIHPYYTIALAPAIGALVGIGAVELWRVRHAWFARAVLAAGLAITAIWAWVLLDRSPGWFPWLRVVIVIAGAAAAGMILARRALRPTAGWRRTVLAAAPVPLALIGGLGAPLAYSIRHRSDGQERSGPVRRAYGGRILRYPRRPVRIPGRRRPAPARRGRRRIRRAGQYQHHSGQAAGGRGVRLPVGRGHGQLHQRGLDRTGQQRRPGHGDRRFLRDPTRRRAWPSSRSSSPGTRSTTS